MIANKLLNYGSEIHNGIDWGIFKQLVSGEPVQARFKYGNSFFIKNYGKLAFNCNTLPTNAEQTDAFFRRFLIIPFELSITEAEKDTTLATRIVNTELAGIFNWVIEGLNRIVKERQFTDSKQVTSVLNRYRKQSDEVQLFMEESRYQPSFDNKISLKILYIEFVNYCKDNGYRHTPAQTFSERLKNFKYQSKKATLAYFPKSRTYTDEGHLL